MSEIPVVDHSHVAEAINDAINYTMYAAFRQVRGAAGASGTAAAAGVGAGSGAQGAVAAEAQGAAVAGRVAAVTDAIAELERDAQLTVRGWYDIAGFRADADALVWLHAPTTEALQAAYRAILDGAAGALEPVWSNIGVHRAAEFNRAHVPAFLAGDAPGDYVCVYPFVRGRDWYLLPDAERSAMLREHGAAARDYGDVLANTVASFGLGDYEWLLAFESNELIRIVDLMRELRATEARRHVIEETPFFTGPRADAATLLARVLA